MRDKRKEKLAKHFLVRIGNKKALILSYKISKEGDADILILKSMIKNEGFSPNWVGYKTSVSISTEKGEIKFGGKCYTFLGSPPIYQLEFVLCD